MSRFLTFLFSLVLLVVVSSRAWATNVAEYYVDDAAIENLLTAAPTVDLQQVEQQLGAVTAVLANHAGSMELLAPRGDNQIVAILLAFFLGGIAIHRVYLGSTPLMILYYIITFFGIFGLVPFVDFLVLIIKGVDSFLDSNKYFAWF